MTPAAKTILTTDSLSDREVKIVFAFSLENQHAF